MDINIFNIQRFSTHDGPGARTVIFFKGCNMRCKWCHNPESIGFAPQLKYQNESCVNCGECAKVCPVNAHYMEHNLHRLDFSKCINCFNCVGVCYAGACIQVGKVTPVLEIFENIKQEIPYMQSSGGGVTFSGGECMTQIDGLVELLKLCKNEGIHTAIDTAGAVDFTYFERVLPYTDLFLYDIKAYSKELHEEYTGINNIQIMKNFEKLVEKKAKIWVRVPVMGGYNVADIENLFFYLNKLPIAKIEPLPYHKLGQGKYESIGERGEAFSVPTKEEMQFVNRLID